MTELALFEALTLVRRVDANGTVRYFNALGKLHREYGPAVIYADGEKFWYYNGQRHRLDGPAVERPDGRRDWYQSGLLHREDGPAVEYSDGSCEWRHNGQRHRLDGPAVEWPDGRRTWYIDGFALTEAEWQQAVASMVNACPIQNTQVIGCRHQLPHCLADNTEPLL